MMTSSYFDFEVLADLDSDIRPKPITNQYVQHPLSQLNEVHKAS